MLLVGSTGTIFQFAGTDVVMLASGWLHGFH